MSSFATCKLNAKFEAALANSRIYVGRSAIDGWGNQGPCIRDRKYARAAIMIRSRPLGCCGMDELDFQRFQAFYESYKDDDESFDAIVAQIIAAGTRQKDERIVVVGLPTKLSSGDSMYNQDFYTKLRATLTSFGFIELCKPYKNKNSGNTIVAMAGQMP